MLIFIFVSQAQEGIISASDSYRLNNFESSSLLYSFNLGSTFFTTYESETAIYSGGILQPNVKPISYSIEEGLVISPNQWPNPFTKEIYFDVKPAKYNVRVYNQLGALVYNELMYFSNKVFLGDFFPGLYFVELLEDQKIIGQYKLIKNE